MESKKKRHGHGPDSPQELAPDLPAAAAFIAALTGDVDGWNVPICFRTFTDDKAKKAAAGAGWRDPLERKLYGTLRELAGELEKRNRQGAGVYLVVNGGDGPAHTDREITEVRALFVDDDSEAIADPAGLEPPPSIVVRTKQGCHVYWLPASPMPVAEFREAQRRLIHVLRTDPAIKNESRIMRVPGFWHLKDPASPMMIRAELLEPTRKYDALEVLAHYPAPPPPTLVAATRLIRGDNRDEANFFKWCAAKGIADGDRNRNLTAILTEGRARVDRGAISNDAVLRAMQDYRERSGIGRTAAQVRDLWAGAWRAGGYTANLPTSMAGDGATLRIGGREVGGGQPERSRAMPNASGGGEDGSETAGAPVAAPEARASIDLTQPADYHAVVCDFVAALHGLNGRSPHIFQRGRDLVRLVHAANGEGHANEVVVLAEGFKPASLKAHIDQRVRAWKVVEEGGETKRKPFPVTKDLAEQLLAQEAWPFPHLRAVMHSPVFAPGGALAAREGFNPDAAVYLDLGGFQVPEVPEAPGPEDLARARALILDELLGDFPFKDEASRAHAVALGLLPFVRPMINGPTPLHLVSAPVYGSGKTKLAKVLSLISTGRHPQVVTAASNDDEWRKRITSSLEKSPTYTVLDNVKKLDTEHLAAVLTADHWEDRVLGSSRNVRLPNLTAWVATGNNPSLSTELARRVAWISLDPETEKPWERQGFRHADLEAWAQENRHALAWAFLVLVRAWLAAGRPPGRESIGSFESWARTIGGVLEVAGVPGFLANRHDLFAEADSESEEWGMFVDEWWSRFGDRPVKTSDLYEVAVREELLVGVLGPGDAQKQKTSLGYALKKHKDRVFQGRKILRAEEDKRSHVARFRLAIPAKSPQICGDFAGTLEKVPAASTQDGEQDTGEVRGLAGTFENLNARAQAHTHTHAHTYGVDPKSPQVPAEDATPAPGAGYDLRGLASKVPAKSPQKSPHLVDDDDLEVQEFLP